MTDDRQRLGRGSARRPSTSLFRRLERHPAAAVLLVANVAVAVDLVLFR